MTEAQLAAYQWGRRYLLNGGWRDRAEFARQLRSRFPLEAAWLLEEEGGAEQMVLDVTGGGGYDADAKESENDGHTHNLLGQ